MDATAEDGSVDSSDTSSFQIESTANENDEDDDGDYTSEDPKNFLTDTSILSGDPNEKICIVLRGSRCRSMCRTSDGTMRFLWWCSNASVQPASSKHVCSTSNLFSSDDEHACL